MTIALTLSLTANVILVILLWADSVAFARQAAMLAECQRQLEEALGRRRAKDAARRYRRTMSGILPAASKRTVTGAGNQV